MPGGQYQRVWKLSCISNLSCVGNSNRTRNLSRVGNLSPIRNPSCVGNLCCIWKLRRVGNSSPAHVHQPLKFHTKDESLARKMLGDMRGLLYMHLRVEEAVSAQERLNGKRLGNDGVERESCPAHHIDANTGTEGWMMLIHWQWQWHESAGDDKGNQRLRSTDDSLLKGAQREGSHKGFGTMSMASVHTVYIVAKNKTDV
ncbi:hypothetical protein B0H19DRAFT_1057023 [Mycena capillaripes]|nr:hypothetical protein B0H19DRAFT_1057023 [Mycena capillaripes]